MADHNDLGNRGETLAKQYVKGLGWKIRECNWRFGKNEVDLIMEKGGCISFVEVKTRSNTYFGEPQEFVSKAKQKRIIKAAEVYVKKYDLDHEVQFDVVAIVMNKNYQKIEYIEEAFSPKW